MFEEIKSELLILEERIRNSLETEIEAISEVTYHLLESGGKRIRPALSILSFKTIRPHDDPESVMDLAVSVEYIHSATLFHDDVVDGAEMRRGKESANSIWGNELPVLVGDFLFAKSFFLLVRSGSMELLELLSRTTTELAEGEILELVKTGDLSLTEEEYFKIIRNKTAVLMAAACKGGGIIAGAKEKEKEALYNFGINFGISFQIMDDCLDYAGDTKTMGKEVGKDLEEGKVTLPLIHLLSKCSKDERNRLREIFYNGKEAFDEIYSMMVKYGSITYSVEKAKYYGEKARKFLSYLPDNKYRSILEGLININLNRRF